MRGFAMWGLGQNPAISLDQCLQIYFSPQRPVRKDTFSLITESCINKCGGCLSGAEQRNGVGSWWGDRERRLTKYSVDFHLIFQCLYDSPSSPQLGLTLSRASHTFLPPGWGSVSGPPLKQDFGQFSFRRRPHSGFQKCCWFRRPCSVLQLEPSCFIFCFPYCRIKFSFSKPLSHLPCSHLIFIFQNLVDTPRLLFPSPTLLNIYITCIPLLSLYWGIAQSQGNRGCSIHQGLPQ